MSKDKSSKSEVPRGEAISSNEASTSNQQPDVLLCGQEHHISAAIEQGLEFGTYRCFPTNPDYVKWDLNERQMEWVRDAGLYHLAQMRWMRIDHALIMGLIERWRPETNTFHLPSGEATITLEDVAYIYGLPIDGPPMTGRTYTHYEIANLCRELLGKVPINKDDYNGISLKFTWLERVFRPTPEQLREKESPGKRGKKKKSKGGAKKTTTLESEEKCRTRAYCFFLVAGQILCNSSGARGPFYILELFREFRPYSWASACLANLYRMLNKGVEWEGLKKHETPDPTDEGHFADLKHKSLSGPLQLLQIWAYTRMKIGRGFAPNTRQNHDIRFPLIVTWANRLEGLTHLTTVRDVRKQLNYLTSNEFEWQPYEEYGKEFLKHVSKSERALFRTDSPLISYWVLERHPIHRVMRQFGLRQTVPPRFIRPFARKENKGRSIIDWSLVHDEEVKSWDERANNVVKRKGKTKGREDDEEYMRWYETVTLMRIGRVRARDTPQRNHPPQPDAQAPIVPQTRVSLFLDHILRSCDRSIAANVDLLSFTNSIKKKVERFRSTCGTTFKDYVETCSSSASSGDDDTLNVGTPKRARVKGTYSKSPTKKPRLSIETPLMIEYSQGQASTTNTLDEEKKEEVHAPNLDPASGENDDIPIEDLISVSPGPEGYKTPPKVSSQSIIVSPDRSTIDSLIWRCKHIPRLRKIPDRFLDYQHPLPKTGYFLTDVEKELLEDFYKYYTHRKDELDMIISCVNSKSLRDLLEEGTWLDSTLIYFWFEVIREWCKDAYFGDPSICSYFEKGLKTGDDMAFAPKGERVMDAAECKTIVYIIHAHNHWSLLVGYVDQNR